jgi:hypothetical protein
MKAVFGAAVCQNYQLPPRTGPFEVESDTMFSTITELHGRGPVKRIIVCALGVFVISILVCNAARAQATAQISGTVRDQTGAVLPGG